MALSPALRLSSEQARAALYEDEEFVKKGLYYFELVLPREITPGGVGGSLYYPLVLPPTSMTVSEPFALEKTFTLGGGLFVEENGILAREITISATAGVAPKLNPGQSAFDKVFPPLTKSHSRSIALTRAIAAGALSGQKHFQFLQDKVFRLYADYKRDVAWSKDTKLFFHVTRDSEKWRVFPMNLTTMLTGKSPLEYPHEFKLLAVNGSAGVDATAPIEDRPVLRKVVDKREMTAKANIDVQSRLDDLSGAQEDLRKTLGNLQFLTDAQEIVNSVNDFLDGTARFILLPVTTVHRVLSVMAGALSATKKAITLGAVQDLPASMFNSLRRTMDGLTVLASYPEQFADTLQGRTSEFNRRQSLATSRTSQELREAEERGSPKSKKEWAQLGTGLLPGDKVRSENELGLGLRVPTYTGARARTIASGDSLPRLAARFMGDARLWKQIAIFNSLQPPFISVNGLPNTLAIGDEILIPDLSKAPEAVDTPATLGEDPKATNEERVLGADYELAPVPQTNLFDLVVDVEGGSTDFKLLVGVPNLEQAVRTRIITEKGSDLLYQTLGTTRIVGVGARVLDNQRAKFSVIDSVQSDPRIASVSSVQTAETADDVLAMELDVVVQGIAASTKIAVQG